MAANFNGPVYQKYLLNILALYKQRQDLKEYLELLFSIAAIGIFVIFAIKPTIITITDLVTKINVEEDTSNKLETKIKNLGIAQTRFNSEENKINLLNDAIPDTPNVPSYVRQLEGLVKKENLKIINTTVQKVDVLSSSASAEQSINPTVSVSGNFDSLKNFLKDIESLRRPGYISKMDFASGSAELNLTITPLAPYSE
jgi:Tfp pilus assembly protein PilO